MSREIKFRAWGKNIKEYLSQDGIEPYVYTLKDISDGSIYDIDDFIIEQYTGVKDRNGKEIYEGDIVEHKTLKDVVVYEIVYSAKHAGFALEEKGLTYYMGDALGLTVVGNIHENERLL